MIDSLDTLGDGRIDQLLRKAPATEQRPTTDLKAVPIKLGENAAPVMGYDTTGDGKVDALDTNGDGVIDTTIVPGRQLKLGEHTNVRGFDTSGDGECVSESGFFSIRNLMPTHLSISNRENEQVSLTPSTRTAMAE